MSIESDEIEIATKVIEEIFEGMTLEKSLLKHGIKIAKFFRIVDNNVALPQAYARAQESKSHLLAEQVVSISDDAALDPNRARNMMQSRQWYVAKINPSKYSERLEVNQTVTMDLRGVLARFSAPVLATCGLDNTVNVEASESKGISHTGATGLESVDVSSESQDEFKKLIG